MIIIILIGNVIADDESYYKYNAHLVTVNGKLKDLYYFIDSKGLHVIDVSDSKVNDLEIVHFNHLIFFSYFNN